MRGRSVVACRCVSRPWTRRRTAAHLAAWVLGVAVFRVGLVPPETCIAPTVEQIDRAVDGAATWATTNVRADGRFLYGYDRARDTIPTNYNLVRHAGMTNALYQATLSGRTELLETTDLTLQYMLDNLVEHNDWVAFAAPGYRVKLGGTGLFVASLVHRRMATGDRQYDDLISGGARFLVQQQQDNGAPLAFWSRETGQPEPGRYSAFGTGEAMWALALAGNIFPDDGFTEAALRVGDYIVNDRRSQEGLVFRLPDHWASYAYDELGGATNSAEARYLKLLATDFAIMTRIESQRTNTNVNQYARWGQALGAGLGALSEGVAGMWRLSDEEPVLMDVRVQLAERLECLAGLMVERQTDASQAAKSNHPELAFGAWFSNDFTQMDDQQHTLSALLSARAAVGFLNEVRKAKP